MDKQSDTHLRNLLSGPSTHRTPIKSEFHFQKVSLPVKICCSVSIKFQLQAQTNPHSTLAPYSAPYTAQAKDILHEIKTQ